MSTARVSPTGADAEPPAPGALILDARGRIVPPTDEQRRARAEALARALADLDEIPDDPPGSDEAFWRAIDDGRPRRKLFEGMY